MGLNPVSRLKKEMKSFFGLIVMNMVLAAMALGLGVSLIIPNLTEVWESGQLLAMPLLNVAVGLASGVLGLMRRPRSTSRCSRRCTERSLMISLDSNCERSQRASHGSLGR